MPEDFLTTPLVSVVMPTYNHGRFLRSSVPSVLNQDYQNIELIIVDNYSDDNTQEIVKSFPDPRISYFKFRNRGIIAASRNAGLARARGEFIAFIDSDDTWYPQKISAQLEYFNGHPEVMLVGCDLKIRSQGRSNNATLLGARNRGKSGILYRSILFKNLISCSSVLVRAEIFKRIGVFDEDPGIMSVEDWDLWLRIAHSYPVCIMPIALGEYCLHGNNTSKTSHMLTKMVCVIDKHTQRRWIRSPEAALLKLLIFLRRVRGAIFGAKYA